MYFDINETVYDENLIINEFYFKSCLVLNIKTKYNSGYLIS